MTDFIYKFLTLKSLKRGPKKFRYFPFFKRTLENSRTIYMIFFYIFQCQAGQASFLHTETYFLYVNLNPIYIDRNRLSYFLLYMQYTPNKHANAKCCISGTSSWHQEHKNTFRLQSTTIFNVYYTRTNKQI